MTGAKGSFQPPGRSLAQSLALTVIMMLISLYEAPTSSWAKGLHVSFYVILVTNHMEKIPLVLILFGEETGIDLAVSGGW